MSGWFVAQGHSLVHACTLLLRLIFFDQSWLQLVKLMRLYLIHCILLSQYFIVTTRSNGLHIEELSCLLSHSHTVLKSYLLLQMRWHLLAIWNHQRIVRLLLNLRWKSLALRNLIQCRIYLLFRQGHCRQVDVNSIDLFGSFWLHLYNLLNRFRLLHTYVHLFYLILSIIMQFN